MRHSKYTGPPTDQNHTQSDLLCFGIIFVGILLRFYHYLAARSLWVDEAMLALNIIPGSFHDLMQPLSYNQIASIGFLWAEKIVVILFGGSEYALRAIPFYCAIGSLFIFFVISRRFLDRYALLIATGLFSLADDLIIHAVEVKPYSVDVFMALLLVFCFIKLVESDYARHYMIITAIAGAAAIWFSFPAPFVLSAIGMIWMRRSFDKDLKARLTGLLGCGLIWLISFGLHYLLVHHKIKNEGMQAFWSGGFMPLFPTSPDDFRWYIDTFFKIFADQPTQFFLPGLGGLCFIAGMISLHKKRARLWVLFILPVIITLIVSGFHLYPFHSRLILFLVPFFILLISEGLRFIYSAIAQHSKLAANILIFLVFLQPVTCQIHRLLNPYNGEEIKIVLQFVEDNIRDGDKLYIYNGAEPAFLYYRNRYHLNEFPVTVGVKGRADLNNYVDELATMKGMGRTWFIFSHVPDWLDVNEKRFYLLFLDRMGHKLKDKQAHGASVYLYDL